MKGFHQAFARHGVIAAFSVALAGPAAGAQQVVEGPVGSGAFGRKVMLLPNGNFVVADPLYDAPGVQDVGAVHLYRPDGVRLSTLTGSSALDRVGSGELRIVGGRNVIVCSPEWDRGAAIDAGAASFLDAERGSDGVISEVNSLIGSRADDRVCSHGITLLSDGDALVRSPFWANGIRPNAGAVTFVDGRSGRSGVLSSANSLTGGAFSGVGSLEPVPLPNGDYVVPSPGWEPGSGGSDLGAATFGKGDTGVAGVISSVNSLVGSQAGDQVGISITVLSDGGYVVRSPMWRNGTAPEAGAATFGSAIGGVAGVVGPDNSLVGVSALDRVSNQGVVALSNGHYVVVSSMFNAPPEPDVGAVTWGSGVAGTTGVVSATNSMLGSNRFDLIGWKGVLALDDGNYVVRSPEFNTSVFAAGAATFVRGDGPATGTVNTGNSLYGTSEGDRISDGWVIALPGGAYLVATRTWDNGTVRDAGSVVFGNAAIGVSGPVSPANALVGEVEGGELGSIPPAILPDGRYAVAHSFWAPAGGVAHGAVVVASSSTGVVGPVTPANSALIGTRDLDQAGAGGLWVLPDGALVVASPQWRMGAVDAVGAVTVLRPVAGAAIPVAPGNSLHGTMENDRVGLGGIVVLANGDFLVNSRDWNLRSTPLTAGAITLARQDGSVVGPVSATNSIIMSLVEMPARSIVRAHLNSHFVVRNTDSAVLGLPDGRVLGQPLPAHGVGGMEQLRQDTADFGYDPQRNQLIAGQPQSNRIILHRTGAETSLSAPIGSPSPSGIGSPVSFSVTLIAGSTPSNGRVTLRADSGESCVDSTPEPVPPASARFACALSFPLAGQREIHAEYTGSPDFAYSRSPTAQHVVFDDRLFGSGFEPAPR